MQNRPKETKSQERLINMMLQAGVEWPEWANFVCRCEMTQGVTALECHPTKQTFGGLKPFIGRFELLFAHGVFKSHHKCVITREQYEARDGWITWHGGECPVAGDAVVEVTLSSGGTSSFGAIKASGFSWVHTGEDDDIIAYRIHKPSAAEPCESVAACIPDQPTIEQLIAEWKQQQEVASKAFAARAEAQELYEDERAKSEQAEKLVQDKLAELGWTTVAQPEPEQPAITDWRDLLVGDVVHYTGGFHLESGEYSIEDIDKEDNNAPFATLYNGKMIWMSRSKVKFIRRPQ